MQKQPIETIQLRPFTKISAFHAFILIEFLWALATLLAFWHVSPPLRDRWVWMLVLAILFTLTKLIVTRRVPLLLLLLGVFWLLTLFNFTNAPLHRENYWVLVCRPLAGIWLVLSAQSLASVWRDLRVFAALTLLLAIFISVLALTSSQWDSKSAAFTSMIEQLPRLDTKAFLPDAQLSFNPNEIAGAMAWLCPLMFGLIGWNEHRFWKIGFVTAGVLLLVALFLGQSRFAIFGVLAALILLAIVMLRRRTRILIISSLIGLAILQVQLVRVVTDVANPTAIDVVVTGLSGRDQSSINTRIQMWQRSLDMLRDYPFTGVGMSMYRTAIRTPQYQIAYFEEINFTAPHTHNEWLQIAVDLGIPGVMWFVLLHAVLAGYVWQISSKRQKEYVWIVGIVAAWLAHTIYGLGDAVTLWDRFAFIFWWVIAWLVAAYEAQKLRYNED